MEKGFSPDDTGFLTGQMARGVGGKGCSGHDTGGLQVHSARAKAKGVELKSDLASHAYYRLKEAGPQAGE